MSGVRRAIMRAIVKHSTADSAKVIPFPGAKKPRAKRRIRPKVVAIKPANNIPNPRVFRDKHGNVYRPVTVGGKNLMRRDDGALFKLRKDGKWVLVNEPRARAARRRSAFGKALPYAAVAAGGAAAGVAINERYRKK